jgi:tetratricopeptide (TPR) repeat protein
MSEITKRTKRLVAELTVFVCVICIWIAKSKIFDIDDVKAGVLEQVVKVDSDNADAYRFLAGHYMDSGSYGDAVKALKQLVKTEPNNAHAHSMLGDACWNCDRYEEAIAAYKQAMRLHVNDPHVHYQIGLVYLEMGDKDSALEEYEILKNIDEESANELLALIRGQK